MNELGKLGGGGAVRSFTLFCLAKVVKEKPLPLFVQECIERCGMYFFHVENIKVLLDYDNGVDASQQFPMLHFKYACAGKKKHLWAGISELFK